VRPNGAAIRAIRTANHVGLRTLATRVERTRGFLSQVETGKQGASPQTIERIAEVLGVPVEAITHRDPA
jgi:transcriptional regulator with XRE-family HTH domain